MIMRCCDCRRPVLLVPAPSSDAMAMPRSFVVPVVKPYPAWTADAKPVAVWRVQKKMIACGWKPTPVIAWLTGAPEVV
jgi:hypothetical protein